MRLLGTEPAEMLGETRVKSWFAWWPVSIDHDWRWLERVTVEQQVMGTSSMGEPAQQPFEWVNTRFVDDA